VFDGDRGTGHTVRIESKTSSSSQSRLANRKEESPPMSMSRIGAGHGIGWVFLGAMASVALVWAIGNGCRAADAPESPQTIPLWPNGVPGSQGTDPDKDVPTLTVWPPKAELATGSAVVVCPGGGYGMLAMDHEGKQVAEWLNSLGITAFVLKYRLGPRYHHPAMLQDAGRAIRTVRAKAGEWKLDPHKIAILGFSAGGHLASTAGTHFDAGKPDADDPIERVSSRPDRMILVYPVIALATPFGHTGSLKNLLGDQPSPELVESLSNERQVSKETPPTFLVHTDADKGVPAENSLLFALALRKAGVPVELHLFERGTHGLGLGGGTAAFRIPADPAFKAWPKLCETWFKNQGFLDSSSGSN
jgi:acetyl esterase/lipase